MRKELSMLFSIGLLSVTAKAIDLKIGVVNNDDMLRMQALSENFVQQNPDITLDWVIQDENNLRQQITTDVSTKAGKFDVISIGAYEASIWSKFGWLSPLNNLPENFNIDDLIPSVREGLTKDGQLYASPFYAESSLTYYRKDLFEKAGIEMAENPSWEFLEYAASEIHDKENEVYGICLRGKPGWGENMALITSMSNAYGARWFNEDWEAQFNSEAWNKTIRKYVGLLTQYGPPEPETYGHLEITKMFQEGHCGIWVDATVFASALMDEDDSKVFDTVGFATSPDNKLGKSSNWLWTWALAVSEHSQQKEAAQKFVAWATSYEYIELVAKQEGWRNAPPGTRLSLYKNQAYLDVAPFAELTLQAIEDSDVNNPTVDEVPYKSIQYVAIPEYQSIGTAVGNRFAKALEGDISLDKALKDSQWVTTKVMERLKNITSK